MAMIGCLILYFIFISDCKGYQSRVVTNTHIKLTPPIRPSLLTTSFLPSQETPNLKASFDDGSSSTTSKFEDIGKSDPTAISSKSETGTLMKSFCQLAPVWTTIAAFVGLSKSSIIAPTLGSLSIMQNALVTLMLAMGLTIAPECFSAAIKNPIIIIFNAILCFGMMPLLAIMMTKVFHYNPSQTAGVIILGSVSGGQASNLFALLAGGDVALSVICTLSTTLIGALITPLLIQRLLKCIVYVNAIAVLKSVTSLVLAPLVCGLSFGRSFPNLVEKMRPFCPTIGVLATLILVAGGAANSVSFQRPDLVSVSASFLLPIIGGVAALVLTNLFQKLIGHDKTSVKVNEETKRTLVIETLSKSPTLAYVIAQKHFGPSAASIPASGMVSFAVVGAMAASFWSLITPSSENKS